MSTSSSEIRLLPGILSYLSSSNKNGNIWRLHIVYHSEWYIVQEQTSFTVIRGGWPISEVSL